ncbi:MAG: hypothetical protein ACLPHP_03650 [Candidatus Sulfotelmatobacter sp.]
MKSVRQSARAFVRYFSVGLAALTLLAAPSASKEPADSGLRQAFTELGSLENYQDFPSTPEGLNACFKDSNPRCWKQYARLRRAVQKLFDHGPEVGLQRTLKAVSEECNAPAQNTGGLFSPWQTCYGAVSSFYFFSTDAEDHQIIESLRKLDQSVLWNIFVQSKGYSGDWIANRPDQQRWIQFLTSLTVLDKDTVGRQGYINVFLHPAKLHTGIMLLDPRLKLPPDQEKRLEAFREASN